MGNVPSWKSFSFSCAKTSLLLIYFSNGPQVPPLPHCLPTKHEHTVGSMAALNTTPVDNWCFLENSSAVGMEWGRREHTPVTMARPRMSTPLLESGKGWAEGCL